MSQANATTNINKEDGKLVTVSLRSMNTEVWKAGKKIAALREMNLTQYVQFLIEKDYGSLEWKINSDETSDQ